MGLRRKRRFQARGLSKHRKFGNPPGSRLWPPGWNGARMHVVWVFRSAAPGERPVPGNGVGASWVGFSDQIKHARPPVRVAWEWIGRRGGLLPAGPYKQSRWASAAQNDDCLAQNHKAETPGRWDSQARIPPLGFPRLTHVPTGTESSAIPGEPRFKGGPTIRFAAA